MRFVPRVVGEEAARFWVDRIFPPFPVGVSVSVSELIAFVRTGAILNHICKGPRFVHSFSDVEGT